MRDLDDHTAQPGEEALPDRPSRPTPPRPQNQWRLHVVALLAFLLGGAAGVGAVLWWQARPAPFPVRADEHAVELVLFEAAQPKSVPTREVPTGEESRADPLRIKAAVLLSGAVTSTVLTIGSRDDSLELRAPALPVTVSRAARYEAVDLTITVRDCAAASGWEPVARPFNITWRDEYGREHLDSAGDFDRSMAAALTGYVDAACGRSGAG